MAFSNVARLRRRLKAIPKGVRKAVHAQLEANSKELNEAQRRFAPKDDGELRGSMVTEDVSTSTRIAYRVKAGGDATRRPIRNSKKGSPTYDYALAQEYGTKNMPANPFFWPPYRAKRKAFAARVNRAAKKAVLEGAKTS